MCCTLLRLYHVQMYSKALLVFAPCHAHIGCTTCEYKCYKCLREVCVVQMYSKTLFVPALCHAYMGYTSHYELYMLT